jgi:enoyl-[acyl-carrier protein] reductase II
MFEGDLVEGELEIGQVAAQIDALKPAAAILEEFIRDYSNALKKLNPME